MPSETDPLLPQGNSAPEISGHGFSKAQADVIDQDDYYQLTEDEDKDVGDPSNKEASSLRSITALFVIVVGVAFLITLSLRGSHHPTFGKPKDSNTRTINARVDRILTQTPLIGP